MEEKKWLHGRLSSVDFSWIQARCSCKRVYGTQYSTEELLAGYAEENPIWGQGVTLAGIGPAEPQTFPAWSSVRRAIGNFAAELYNAKDEAEVEAILEELTNTANDLVEEVR